MPCLLHHFAKSAEPRRNSIRTQESWIQVAAYPPPSYSDGIIELLTFLFFLCRILARLTHPAGETGEKGVSTVEHSENKKVDLVNRKMISFVTINDVSRFLLFLTMISPCGCGDQSAFHFP